VQHTIFHKEMIKILKTRNSQLEAKSRNIEKCAKCAKERQREPWRMIYSEIEREK